MEQREPVPDSEWETIVENVPIVSVDLVVRVDDAVLLGKRTNEPLAGEWFVPGGRLFKNEALEAAVHRIARAELGIDVTIERQLGVDEHRDVAAELPGIERKHYVPIAYEVTPRSTSWRAESQHEALRLFSPPFEDLEMHPFLRAYLTDAGLIAGESE